MVEIESESSVKHKKKERPCIPEELLRRGTRKRKTINNEKDSIRKEAKKDSSSMEASSLEQSNLKSTISSRSLYINNNQRLPVTPKRGRKSSSKSTLESNSINKNNQQNIGTFQISVKSTDNDSINRNQSNG